MWAEIFDIEKTICPICGGHNWLVWDDYLENTHEVKSLLCVECKAKFNSPDDFLKAIEEKNKKPVRKTVFNFILDDWKRVKNHCRTTVNKGFTDNEPTE